MEYKNILYEKEEHVVTITAVDPIITGTAAAILWLVGPGCAPGQIVLDRVDSENSASAAANAGDWRQIARTGELRARAFHRGKPVSPVVSMLFERVPPRLATRVSDPLPGLWCSTYAGDWNVLPDLAALESEGRAVAATVEGDQVAFSATTDGKATKKKTAKKKAASKKTAAKKTASKKTTKKKTTKKKAASKKTSGE